MSVTPPTTTRKAFYAGLGRYEDEIHGILTMDDDGVIWFREHGTSQLIHITPELLATQELEVRGEVGLADTQLLRDGDRVLKCSKTLVAA